MKFKTLKEQYEYSLKLLSSVMVVGACFFIILGFIFMTMIWWGGLILITIGILTFVEFYFIKKYLEKKIKECSEE